VSTFCLAAGLYASCMPIRCSIRWLGASPVNPCQLLSLTGMLPVLRTSATAVAAPSLGSFARCRCSPSSNASLPTVSPRFLFEGAPLHVRACHLPTHVRPAPPPSAQSLHAEPDDVRTFQTAVTGLHVRLFRHDADRLSHVARANRKIRTAEFRFSLLIKGPFARASQERWKRRDR
jgi:hypothetical protein